MSRNLVILAEKANAAEAYAEAIGVKNLHKNRDGFLEGEVSFSIGSREEPVHVEIVHSQGHCLRLLDPEEIDENYKKWDVAMLPIPFDDNKLKAIDDYKERKLNAIKKALGAADYIINAGDSGREGELIQRWILKEAGKERNIYRLWTSSLTIAAIKKAYDNLLNDPTSKEMLDNLYASGKARAIMDKYIGFNYSRLISLTKTAGVTVNYGRCKSPLTHAIIERDLEIENFVKRPFSYIKLKLGNEITFNGVLISDNGEKLEFDNHAAAAEVLEKLQHEAKVISVKKENGVDNPPKPFDILTIQKEMSKKYDYEADVTLSICQDLYDKHKILSYPRTDSRYLTADLKEELKDTVKALDFGEFKQYVSSCCMREIPNRYFNDKKVIDHHGLIPVVPQGGIETKYEKLNEAEKNVYDAIIKNFISLFMESSRYEKTEIITEAAGYKIKSKLKNVTEIGYKALFNDDAVETDDVDILSIGSINEGELISINEKEVVDTETKPKQHFTTASLLDFMKIHNIGTGATRDGIIKELTEKKGHNVSSTVKKDGKYFISTEFGRSMDAVIPDRLKSIEFLSEVDGKLADVENGKLSFDDFMADVQAKFKADLIEMASNTEVLMENKREEKAIFDCPCCGNKLVDKGWGYACKGWKKDGSGCNFNLPKKISGKTLSEKVLLELLTYKTTKKEIKGFKSQKSGKKYNARLKLDIVDGKSKISYIFNN